MTSAIGHWVARTVANPIVWVALVANIVLAVAGVRLGTRSNAALSSSAWGFLSLGGWIWGTMLLGLAVVGDLRAGYAALVAVRSHSLRAHVTAAVLVAGGAAVLVVMPAAIGTMIADAVFRPEQASVSLIALLVSTLGLAAVAATGAALAGLAGTVGLSKGAAGSVSIVLLLLGQLVGRYNVVPQSVMDTSTPNWVGVVVWTAVAGVLVVVLRAATERRGTRLVI